MGMTPIPLGHLENDWKCIAVNLGLLPRSSADREKNARKTLGGWGDTGKWSL